MPDVDDGSLAEFNRSLTAMTGTFQHMTRCKRNFDFRLAKQWMTLFSCRLDHRRTLRNRSAAFSTYPSQGSLTGRAIGFGGFAWVLGRANDSRVRLCHVSALTGINMYRSTQTRFSKRSAMVLYRSVGLACSTGTKMGSMISSHGTYAHAHSICQRWAWRLSVTGGFDRSGGRWSTYAQRGLKR